MNYKEIAKKYWFAGVIAIFLIAGLIFFATDSLKGNVKGLKTEDGKDVLFQYNEKFYTADDLYDEVYDILEVGAVIPVFELEIYRDAMEPTDTMKSDVKANNAQLIQSLKGQYGEKWEETLDMILLQNGYLAKKGVEGLEDFSMILETRTAIEREYIKEHKEIYEDYFAKNEPRSISHILVKMEDPDNPTAEESKKLEDAKAALAKDGALFADVAREFSDDGSAEKGGSLGLQTKTTIEGFVENFKNNVYTVNSGETTEWFKTEFGYHIIKVDATTLEEFEALNDYTVYDKIFEENSKLRLDITWDQVIKQEITFGDNEKLNAEIKKHYTGEED